MLDALAAPSADIYKYLDALSEFDDIDLDDLLMQDTVDPEQTSQYEIDIVELRRAVGIETMALMSLTKEASLLLDHPGDMKIKAAVEKAIECIEQNDIVLLFSRYTDTIDALRMAPVMEPASSDRRIIAGLRLVPSLAASSPPARDCCSLAARAAAA